jgi:predicted PhzF superfamily epimerase YddE/YHI9
LTWIKASLAGTPPWKHEQLTSVNLVENFEETREHTVIWAWLDENKGIVRARTFAPDWGIPEDEANGSGSMQLAAMLGKRLEIHHGKGSIIYAYPLENNSTTVGGRVKEIQERELEIWK